MLHILLLILKILGIIIACILGLILLILLLVLLVPIRYSGSASFYEKQPKFLVKVGWIPGLIAVILSNHTGKIGLKIKVCGLTIKDTLKPPKEAKDDKKSKKDKEAHTDQDTELKDIDETQDVFDVLEAMDEDEAESEKKAEPEKVEDAETPETSDKKASEEVKKTKEKKPKEKKPKEKKPKEKKAKVPKAEKEKIPLGEKLHQKYEEISEKLKAKLQSLSEKLKSLQDKKNQVTDLFLSDKGKATIFRVKRLVFKLLYHIRPRKIRGYVHLGMGDGYKTAKTLSIISLFYPIYTTTWKVEPEFDQKVMEGDMKLRGHLTLGYIAILGLRGVLDKDLRKMIRDIKNLKNG